MEETHIWRHVKDLNHEYYSPYGSYRYEYSCIGDEDGRSTTKERVDYLNSNIKIAHELDGIFKSTSRTQLIVPCIELPAGVYRFQEEQYTPMGDVSDCLKPINLVEGESYVHMPEVWDTVDKDIITFLSSRELYLSKGFIYKLGILLYGSPGNGKTVYMRKIVNTVIPKEAIVIFMPDLPQRNFIDRINVSLRNRLKVFIFEELAAAVEDKYDVEQLLNFLDGEASIPNSIFLATTNYPDRIPHNIIDRPSRFDKLYKINPPEGDSLKQLLDHFLEREPTRGELLAAKSLSIADLKEISLLIALHNKSFEEGVKTLKDRHNLCAKNFAEAKVGFGL